MDRAIRGLREAALFFAGPRDADFLLVDLFLAEEFLFIPALRALDFFRPDECVRPRAATPLVRFFLELRRDDFLVAAMVQLRGKNVPIDNSKRLYSNFRAQKMELINPARMFRQAGAL